jgi:hypothetical protein
MEKVYRIWEIELQAVLEITKIGHRKRILYSLIGQRLNPPIVETQQVEIEKKETTIPDNNISDNTNHNNEKPVILAKPTTLSKHKKNRPAPQPPVLRSTNIEIRAPEELLLTPSGMKAEWRHPPASLISGSVKYEVFVGI